MNPVQEQWLYLISLNDRKAFKAMFEHFYAALCVYARHYVKSTGISEDIVQNVFCNVWIKRHSIDYHIPAGNYLMAAVRNRCLNYLRDCSGKRLEDFSRTENLFSGETSDSPLMLDELERQLSAALSKLPPAYRMAFEMSCLEDSPIGEIAKAMSVSVRTVERYRNKAIELLKTELKHYLLLFLLF